MYVDMKPNGGPLAMGILGVELRPPAWPLGWASVLRRSTWQGSAAAARWVAEHRRPSIGVAAAAGVVAAGLTAAYAVFVEPRHIVVERLRVPVPDLDPRLDGFTLVQLSDLHCGAHPRWPGLT